MKHEAKAAHGLSSILNEAPSKTKVDACLAAGNKKLWSLTDSHGHLSLGLLFFLAALNAGSKLLAQSHDWRERCKPTRLAALFLVKAAQIIV